jgi:chromosome segregation ATPase
MTSLYEQCRKEILAHRERQEELGRHAEDLAAEVQAEREGREQLENELDSLERQREDDTRRRQRTLEEKEAELRSALDNASRQKAILSERDADLAALQAALKNLEVETRRAGESHTSNKFSLELELDRLKRDVERMEDDLNRARAELADREAQNREREGQMDRLHAANRDLTAELATQTQARLNATEKLDSTQASLKVAETELTAMRARMSDLEQRLSKDQRSLLTNESQFRDQLTERNTLLLTIYQYMDKILGVDKSPVSCA